MNECNAKPLFLLLARYRLLSSTATSRDCRWALCARLWKDPPVWADETELRGSEWSGWYKYFSLCTLRRCSQQGVYKAPEATLTPPILEKHLTSSWQKQAESDEMMSAWKRKRALVIMFLGCFLIYELRNKSCSNFISCSTLFAFTILRTKRA